MASITPDEFRARFRQFRDTTQYPDNYIQLMIKDTECEIDEGAFGCWFPRAQACLMAHMIAIDDLRGAANSGSEGGSQAVGRVSSESEGDTSVSYDYGFRGALGNDTLLATTSYGQEYLEIRAKAIIGGISTGLPC